MKTVHLAFDFGASSGRLMLGEFDGERLSIEEVHRFPNEPVWFNGRYYLDFLRLFHEMKAGLKKVALKGTQVDSMGICTWGVDFGFLDEQGHLLANPVNYRDDRGRGMLEEIEEDTGLTLQEIYNITGNKFMTLNTLFQLYYDVKYRPHLLEKADALLFTPDLFAYALTGQKYNEYTMASTSQMLDARQKEWAVELLEKLNIPTRLLQPLVMPGQIWGEVSREVQEEVGLGPVPVVAVASHDTASAVCATPLRSRNSAYLSCGTWSLLGVELTEPLINCESYEHNFTNEGGVEGTIRYLKNIVGLWIIQRLKRKWSQTDPSIGYPEISRAAREADHIACAVDPNHESFIAPFDMEEAVLKYCQERLGQKPKTRGELARAAYNGIVLEYKRAIEGLEKTLNREVDCINLVGGGTQDEFLCQLTADLTGKPVFAGPVEASVTGNILMQLQALGRIQDVAEGRRLVERSCQIKEYRPN